MLVAVRRDYSDLPGGDGGLTEQIVRKLPRGYETTFCVNGEVVERTRVTKHQLLQDHDTAVIPWMFLDTHQLIAVRRIDRSDMPEVESLRKISDGYELHVESNGLARVEECVTFAEAVRWLNDQPEAIERA